MKKKKNENELQRERPVQSNFYHIHKRKKKGKYMKKGNKIHKYPITHTKNDMKSRKKAQNQ